MATQSLSAEMIAPPIERDAVICPTVHYETDLQADDRPMAPARGIIMAVLISAPFWALFAFVLYKLL